MLPLLVTDRYIFAELLGQGGMGRVWKARDKMLQRDVAIKEIVPPPGLTEEARQELRVRSLREARAIARLDHVNAVRVFDVLLGGGGDPWIVMEYVPSRSLDEQLATDGPIPPARAAEIGLGVLGALRAAHRAGIMHRDVKPANILLGTDGRIVLTDFGLATATEDTNLTLTGIVLGSPAYVSPERAMTGTVGPEGDLWSLGATLFAAVEGQSPYARPSSLMSLTALATEPPPVARHAGPLAPVLAGLLRKDPAERMDADTVEKLLRQVASGAVPAVATAPGTLALTAATVEVPTTLPTTTRPTGATSTDGAARVELRYVDPPLPTTRYPTPPAGTPYPGSAGTSRPAPASEPTPAGSAATGLAATGPTPAGPAGGTGREVPSRRLRPAWLVGAVTVLLLVLGIGIGIPLATRQPEDDAGLWAESPSGAPEPAPTDPPGAGPNGGAPAQLSWSTYRDASGFSLPAPKEWQIVRRNGRVEFREPDGDRVLVVSRTNTPRTDPVAEVTAQEKTLPSDGTYRDYRRIRIVAVNYQLSAADWEWQHTNGSDQVVHVRQRTFVTGKQQGYTIVWSTPESSWSTSEGAFRKVVDGFRPAAGVDGGPGDSSAPPTTAPADPPPVKPSNSPRVSGYQLVGVASNRCLDVANPDSVDPVWLRLWDCGDGRARNQRWTFQSDGSIRLGGRCMDVLAASASNGATIQLTTCNNTPAQKFTLNSQRQLVNAHSGMCLDALDEGSANGTPIQQWTCNNGALHQKWTRR
ncbi:ricin-type beta-trefoil lectin domain protein [Plantactinospora sp. B5E13]|uniref:serine/threonine protein kinase n=1 Tax=Plantactinospora sp. B5E13 TaxID=3153758 RepID=UPI00325D0022